MKKLQNVLYITKQGSYLHKERETLVIEHERKKIFQLPIHSLSGIYCFGNVLVSPFIYDFCGNNSVQLAFFSEYGKFFGRMQTKQSGNVLLRKAQYRYAETSAHVIASNIVAAKIQLSRQVLMRYARNNHDTICDYTISILKCNVSRVKNSTDMDYIRGIEGESAARYFSHFNSLILNKDFYFENRNRRPPRDPVNAMLSFMYTIVSRDISSALQGVGLDPQAGFLHTDRPGRDSLALDILEEFRAWLVDRLILTVINLKQVELKDFKVESSGAVLMGDDTRKTLLKVYQEKKHETVMHSYLKQKVKIGLLFHIQAQLLASHIRGELEFYPPFYVR